MKAVGIKKLKAQLSEFVRRARAGETILVTDRDEVVAELRPPRSRLVPSDDLEDALDALAEAKEVSRAPAPKRGWTWKVTGAGLSAAKVSQALADDRDDRA